MAVILYFLARYFMHGIGVAGWASVFVSIYFIGGLLLANMGVLGLYLGKVLNEVRDRPLYLIRDLVNFEDRAPDPSESSDILALTSVLSEQTTCK